MTYERRLLFAVPNYFYDMRHNRYTSSNVQDFHYLAKLEIKK